MNERKRVLDLVKKGVLSTEEALDLLEGMAKEKDEVQNQKDNDRLFEEKQAEQTGAEDKKQLEEELARLAEKANQASVKLDEVNDKVKNLKKDIAEKQEQLMELDMQEELEENVEVEENRQQLRSEKAGLEDSLADLLEERAQLEKELKGIRRDQWHQKKEKLSEKMDIPDDWKDQASDSWNQFGDKMAEAGSQLGDFLKKTFDTVSETVSDNMEWKDVSLRVPGVSTTKFEKTFNFEDATATILDVKVANGSMTFERWDEDAIKIDAKVKLYGKMDAATPEEAFEQRSQVTINEDRLAFKVPNKRVRCDLVFYLPNRVYDHVSVKSLNGMIQVNDLDVKDIYLKTTNGQINIEKINASMLEVEGVHGAINIKAGDIIDSIIETVNGNVTMSATPKNLGVSIVNGDIRLTLHQDQMTRLEASAVNGNIKVALPMEMGIEGRAKTSLGSINSRLSDYEVVGQKDERTNRSLDFRRLKEEMAQLDLSTTTGNIYLKDTDK